MALWVPQQSTLSAWFAFHASEGYWARHREVTYNLQVTLGQSDEDVRLS